MTAEGRRSAVDDEIALILLDPEQPEPVTRPALRADLLEIPEELR